MKYDLESHYEHSEPCTIDMASSRQKANPSKFLKRVYQFNGRGKDTNTYTVHYNFVPKFINHPYELI